MNSSELHSEQAKYALVFATNSAFATGLLTTLASVFCSSNLKHFNIYIGHDQSDPIDSIWESVINLCQRFNYPIDRCQRIAFNTTIFQGLRTRTGNFEAYFRYQFTQILSENRILYLDSDTLVLNDLAELASTHMQGNAIAAVQDLFLQTHRKDPYRLANSHKDERAAYFNSGVLLMDTKRCKELNILERFKELHPQLQNLEYSDQTYANVIFNKQWTQLAAHWNALLSPKRTHPIANKSATVGILHYVTKQKPWLCATLDAPNILWHSIAHHVGISVSIELERQIREQIERHIHSNHTRLRLKLLTYQLRPSRNRKAMPLAQKLKLREDFDYISKWLKEHQLTPPPEMFHRLS
ncbi:MAG TPA: hypothetical protein DCX06_02215 [Opitutae bacterium]|nr:hypothetical protein [Opitutae bacterium]